MTSNDPDFWEKPADVSRLYLNPPLNAALWSVGGQSGMQAESSINPTSPAVRSEGAAAALRSREGAPDEEAGATPTANAFD